MVRYEHVLFLGIWYKIDIFHCIFFFIWWSFQPQMHGKYFLYEWSFTEYRTFDAVKIIWPTIFISADKKKSTPLQIGSFFKIEYIVRYDYVKLYLSRHCYSSMWNLLFIYFHSINSKQKKNIIWIVVSQDELLKRRLLRLPNVYRVIILSAVLHSQCTLVYQNLKKLLLAKQFCMPQ